MQMMSKSAVSRHAICIISWCNLRYFSVSFDSFYNAKHGRLHVYLPQIIKQHRAG
ncbi:hypothetical protein HMPREF9420_1735 [Segatella salivae DSM 15606]|uniref:Uncharacterized protein n=1 Tax=Segatella salivae DSM 15606 TaxID=888832 RepID=E6MQG7_9BACT|nr:hypothetical protein HMPREF9420_1735 [Segatella salivae DSM 15606]